MKECAFDMTLWMWNNGARNRGSILLLKECRADNQLHIEPQDAGDNHTCTIMPPHKKQLILNHKHFTRKAVGQMYLTQASS